jgi:hypothetical protein
MRPTTPDDRIEPQSIAPAPPDLRRDLELQIVRINALYQRVGVLEVSGKEYRKRLKSIPAEIEATAESTVERELKAVRAKLEEVEKEKKLAALTALNAKLIGDQKDVERVAAERRALWERRAWGLVRALLTGIGGLLAEHYLHVLPH